MKQVFSVVVVGCLVAALPAREAPGQTVPAGRYIAEDITPAPERDIFPAAYDLARGQAVGSVAAGLYNHAALWDMSTGRVVDLHPTSGYFNSEARSAAAGQQVGHADLTHTGNIAIYHAFLWRGTAASRVNLNPPGSLFSSANDTDGSVQVGGVYFGQFSFNKDGQAALWRGTAASFVDLTPTHLGCTGGYAMAVEGGKQVGLGLRRRPNGTRHYTALLWTGTAASAVELPTPAGLDSAIAYGLGGGQLVGEAFMHGTGQLGRHAVVWTGEGDSVVDLHPAGYTSSTALDSNGVLQVGNVTEGRLSSNVRAAVWGGSAESFVNLHDFLPAGYLRSDAREVDALGNVYGHAVDAEGRGHRIVWRAVPEPSALAVHALAAALVLRRRRRGRTASASSR